MRGREVRGTRVYKPLSLGEDNHLKGVPVKHIPLAATGTSDDLGIVPSSVPFVAAARV